MVQAMTLKKKKSNPNPNIFDLELLKIGYSADLARPIVAKVPRTELHTGLSKKEWDQRLDRFGSDGGKFFKKISRERRKKLDVLCEAMGLALDDPHKWERLSLLLAVKHVPGMRVHDKTITNLIKWTSAKRAHFLGSIESSKKKSGLSVSQTIAFLVKKAIKDGQSTYIFYPPRLDLQRSTGEQASAIKAHIAHLKNEHSKSLKNREALKIKLSMDKQQKPTGYSLATLVTQDLWLHDTRQQWAGWLRTGCPEKVSDEESAFKKPTHKALS